MWQDLPGSGWLGVLLAVVVLLMLPADTAGEDADTAWHEYDGVFRGL